MSDETNDSEIKSCCANFYQSDVVRKLFGDVFHPGGLALTRRLGEMLKLTQSDAVLDVACGRGSSAVHLAERFGCHVTGLDYGARNIVAAHALAEERGFHWLGPEVPNSRTKTSWECQWGHPWKAPYSIIQQGYS